MSPPKKPMPARPSALGRAPSFAPGARPSVRPPAPLSSRALAPLAPIAPVTPKPSARPSAPKTGSVTKVDTAPPVAPEPQWQPDLLDGPTVTSFDADFPIPDAPAPTFASFGETDELEAIELEPTFDDEPTRMPADYAAPAARSFPPPRPSVPAPRPSAAARSIPPARHSTPPPRPSSPAPRNSVPPARPSVPAPRNSVPPARPSIRPNTGSHPVTSLLGHGNANPFLAPSQAPQPHGMFDDVNTAFVGGQNMAPDFAALEARVSRPDWEKHVPDDHTPPPMRQRAHSIDMGEGVVVETLAGFEPNRPKKHEVSEAWRPEGLPHTDLLDAKPVMRFETVHPPASAPPPQHVSAAPPRLGFAEAPALYPIPQAPRLPSSTMPGPRQTALSIDMQTELARANQGKVRIAYVVAGISILLLVVAILSAVLTIY